MMFLYVFVMLVLLICMVGRFWFDVCSMVFDLGIMLISLMCRILLMFLSDSILFLFMCFGL